MKIKLIIAIMACAYWNQMCWQSVHHQWQTSLPWTSLETAHTTDNSPQLPPSQYNSQPCISHEARPRNKRKMVIIVTLLCILCCLLVWSYCLLIFLGWWGGLFPLHSQLISSSWHTGMGFLIQVLEHSGADCTTFTCESFLVESDKFGSESKLSTSIDSLGASNVAVSSLSKDESKVFFWYIRGQDA